jgi:hypothetical protein
MVTLSYLITCIRLNDFIVIIRVLIVIIPHALLMEGRMEITAFLNLS